MDKGKLFKLVGSLFLLLVLPLGVIAVRNVVKYFSGATGIPANLVVDMGTDYGQSQDTWRNLAQGGEEKGRMLAPVISQVQALRPEYIRIDHVFDYYNQGDLDAVIGDITATGAKPFIAISYMPPDIAKGGDINAEPNNWSDWEARVQALVEHVSGRGGLAISNVYYEVWNEPDLFGGYKIGGSKSYLDLYSHTVSAANRAGNTLPFKIGGPATTGYYKNWMTGLLDFVNRTGLRLDFLSWHDYSKDMDSYVSDTNGARNLLAQYNLEGREMIISEMGPNSENDTVYDGYFGAIHEIATATVLQDEVDKTFTFEIIDGPGNEKYWGRWGLYTNPKFGAPEAKPRVSALNFLNSMSGGSKLSILGQGSWVRAFAKKLSNGIIRILLVNYDPNGKHEELVPVKFVNLPSQNFSLKRVEFLGSSFSQDVATTSGEWATTQYLKPNSAMILEVTPR